MGSPFDFLHHNLDGLPFTSGTISRHDYRRLAEIDLATAGRVGLRAQRSKALLKLRQTGNTDQFETCERILQEVPPVHLCLMARRCFISLAFVFLSGCEELFLAVEISRACLVVLFSVLTKREPGAASDRNKVSPQRHRGAPRFFPRELC